MGPVVNGEIKIGWYDPFGVERYRFIRAGQS